ncbi:MAG: vitamin B12 dependent methionine synthase [Coriobacteriia bacterium]|nr:vitamin B12 dependent methionine synthase [Coriobacteriia bacterium]
MKTHREHRADSVRYRVDESEALRYMGYADQELDSTLASRIRELFGRCEQMSSPGWMYRVFSLSEDGEGLRLDGTTLVLTGNDIRSHLEGARECAVMAATLGLANERELRRVSLLNGLDGMIFDAASSALVETVADACNAAIVAEAHARGLHAKWRFSPGYGDLPLGLQAEIVRVLAADKQLGVTATDTDMLIPAKSVTAFVGLFDMPQDTERTCAHCSFAPYCDLRRKGTQCYR